MKIKPPVDGYFVDYDGKICSTLNPGDGLRCMFEEKETYTCVLVIDTENFVVGEYVYYPDKESIYRVLIGE